MTGSSSSSSSDSNIVIIGGMVGEYSTFFTNDPVIVVVGTVEFPPESTVRVVRLDVIYDDNGTDVVVGEFSGDAGVSSSLIFDISSALRTLWSGCDFSENVTYAQSAATDNQTMSHAMEPIPYKLRVYTEYISSVDGYLVTTDSGDMAGGLCIPGGRTEMERSGAVYNDISILESSNLYNGDASTKPHSSPERVGSNSITSWVDIGQAGTTCYYYPASATPGQPSSTPHAPIVIRDTVPYMDFLFVNRRGAVETCSAKMLESLDMTVEAKQYNRCEVPTYRPSRSIMSVATGGRRSWSMSSGYQTREWAEWWALEFLMARRHWMFYKGKYVPVTVTPSKKATSIYDRTKQQMPSVEFTVTLALEG